MITRLFDDQLPPPWRCTACSALMYNVDRVNGQNYPGEGAPHPLFLSTKFPKVCKMCWDMFQTLHEREYWRKLEDIKIKNNRKLKDGESSRGLDEI